MQILSQTTMGDIILLSFLYPFFLPYTFMFLDIRHYLELNVGHD